MNTKNTITLLLGLASIASMTLRADPMPTGFTYQGMLTVGTNAANGHYDFRCAIYDAVTDGNLVGPVVTNTATAVANSFFDIFLLMSDDSAFQGEARWLEIAVRTNGGGGFLTLTPRQQITPTPYALYAPSAGTAAIATSASSFSGTVSGDVAGTQGATVVAAVGGQSAASVASGVIAANAATSANTPNTIVARDGSGSFSAQTVSLNGVLNLPSPAIIYSGSNTILIANGSYYAGAGAGNADPLTPDLHNVGVGDRALYSDNAGTCNTGIGESNLFFNTTGSFNTAGGSMALYHNTTGSRNKADGYQALYSNTTGSNNTAIGYQSLFSNTLGSWNTAVGEVALESNTTGNRNTAIGEQALYFNTIGTYNVANGHQTLGNNASGSFNSANGALALIHNTTGNNNTAEGYMALPNNTSGINNIGVGYQAGEYLTTGDNNIDIGNPGFDGEGNTIRVGVQGTQTSTYVAGIWETSLSTPAKTVVVDNLGHLGTGAPIVPGVTTVTGSGDITVSPTSGNVIVGSDATSLDTFSTIVRRDGNGSFGANNIWLGSAGPCENQEGVLNLPPTTPTAGMITLGGCDIRFLHGYGAENFFGGAYSGNFTMSGGYNTGLGYQALGSDTTGYQNTGVGAQALYTNTTGIANTANGYQALTANTSGSYNTAVGEVALKSNTTGDRNTAIGEQALSGNTIGTLNVANGHQTLGNNTSGSFNSANGALALFWNGSGSNNTANGYAALYGSSGNKGNNNTADGVQALWLTTGNNNTAAGVDALKQVASGNNNIALGYQAGSSFASSESTNIDIGNPGFAGDDNTIRIGVQGTHTNTYIAGIHDFPAPTNWYGVYVGSDGHLGARATGVGVGGVSSVTGSQHITANPTTGDVVVGSDATDLAAPSTLVSRDSNGSFGANNIWLGNVGPCPGQEGVLNLPTTTANAGMITLGGCDIRFLHGYGSYNFFGGTYAGNFTMNGGYNTGLGYLALVSDTSGQFNTGVGAVALSANTTGEGNTAIGFGALTLNVSGNYNTANGQSALGNNTSGSGNTANGREALFSNSSGSDNTANGYWALFSNADGSGNTADGKEALWANTGGSENTAIGHRALYVNTTGNNNTAHGASALYANASGSGNTADGGQALYYNARGSYNTANGYQALANAINTNGNYNIALGYQAGYNITAGDNNIDIGNQGVAGEGNTIRIGVQGTQTATFVAGIYGTTITEAPVFVNSVGQLGVGNSSSRKFKQDIQSMADTSDELLALRPVTFKYKPGIDPQGIQRFGLVAEEVEQVDPNLVVHDQEHGVYSVRYEAVNAMLLNEFLKQHRRLEEQTGEIAMQNAEIGALKEKAAKVDLLEKRLGELEQLMESLKATK
jgi:hypothetical protein